MLSGIFNHLRACHILNSFHTIISFSHLRVNRILEERSQYAKTVADVYMFLADFINDHLDKESKHHFQVHDNDYCTLLCFHWSHARHEFVLTWVLLIRCLSNKVEKKEKEKYNKKININEKSCCEKEKKSQFDKSILNHIMVSINIISWSLVYYTYR